MKRSGRSLIAAALTFACGTVATASSTFDAVVLITVDTLRADHLGIYGHSRPTSPALDRFAEDALVFDRAVATCPATAPSVAAMMTGLYHDLNGVFRNRSHLPRSVDTLAELLRRSGFRTSAVVANGVLNRRGFEQGFDRFVMASPDPKRPALGVDVTAIKEAGRQIRALRNERFFLWVHLMAPHGPYTPPPAYLPLFRPRWYRRQGEVLPTHAPTNYGLDIIPLYQRLGRLRDPAVFRARYDAEVRYADALVTSLFRRLRRAGLWDRTLLVFTADHGESLGEHRAFFQHGRFAYDATVRVPLLIRAPGRWDATRIPSSVSLVDLTPTVLELVGVQPELTVDGRSLVPIVERSEGDRAAFVHTYYRVRYQAVTLGSWKYIRRGSEPDFPMGEELYDTAADASETVNLVQSRPAEHARLASRMRGWMHMQAARRPRTPATLPPDNPAERRRFTEQLRALGYVD